MIARCSFVHRPFFLRSTFAIPSILEARNKRRNNDGTVVDMLIHSIVKLLGLGSMKFLYIHISCVSTPFKHLEQSKTGFLDKMITYVIWVGSGKNVVKRDIQNLGLK